MKLHETFSNIFLETICFGRLEEFDVAMATDF